MRGKNYDKVLLFIACTVTIVWVMSVVVQTFWKGHSSPDSVNTVMIVVATSFFAGSAASNIRKGSNSNGNGKPKEPDA